MVRLSELMHPDGYPRAPSQAVWDALTPEERLEVVAVLPGEVTDAEQAMPEGDRHFGAKIRALDALRGHFNRLRRPVYVAAELPIYYPAARRFAPDLLVVFDVDDHERDKYVVSHEGKGLDFVLEVHVGGDRKKDAERNVERYAGLGIPEYFMFDGGRQELLGFRLPDAGGQTYAPIVPEGGRFSSRSLGLDLQVEEGRLRFFHGAALLLESDELIRRLEGLVAQVTQRAEREAQRAREEAQRAQEAAQRAQEEASLRAELERRLAEANEELERLRHPR